MQIHIHREGQNYGPYALEVVNDYLQAGKLSPEDLAWLEGGPGWIPLHQVPGVEASAIAGNSQPPPAQYHHVAMWKFVVLSVCTLGIYEFYWFYQNWKFVKRRDGSDIMPFWRAFFGVLWCFALAKDVARSSPRPTSPAWLAIPVLYLLMTMTWRLPNPWWLVSLAGFAPLCVLVGSIDQINRLAGRRSAYYSRFGLGPIVLSFLGSLLLVVSVADGVGLLVPDRVVAGHELRAADRRFLQDEAFLESDEEALFFYSPGITSIADEGYLLTDQRVVAYFREPETQELFVSEAGWDEIVEVETTYSESAWEDTEVHIQLSTDEDDGFYLVLSATDEGDRRFVERLTMLWNAARARSAAGAGNADE